MNWLIIALSIFGLAFIVIAVLYFKKPGDVLYALGMGVLAALLILAFSLLIVGTSS